MKDRWLDAAAMAVVFIGAPMLLCWLLSRSPPAPRYCPECGHEWEYHGREVPDGSGLGCVHPVIEGDGWCGCGMREQ